MTLKNLFRKLYAAMSAALLLALASTAAQAATTWNFSNCNGYISQGGTCGTISASTPAEFTASVSIYGHSTAPADTSTTIQAWSGSGIGYIANNADKATGAHAVDNVNGIDGLIFQFGQGGVSLTSVTAGWNGDDDGSGSYTDSDMALYYWNGGSAPTFVSGTALTYASNAWVQVGTTDLGYSTSNTQTYSNLPTSSYWLVSAYSGSMRLNDSFKVLALAGLVSPATSTGVPEPGSLALLGLGAAGLLTARRRSVARR